ncbi:MAG: xanthine dehydrogenase family protein molybdopterin-binding subunit [Betaproteobacteria bacterium]|nr:xanthine dehydrogenase family protein molybdopterin-binding subunit [Betaproteobacteria bacterium]
MAAIVNTAIVNTVIDPARRRFLQGAGGLTFCIVLDATGVRLIGDADAQKAPVALSAWVRIAPEGTVTIYTPGAEMGQGSMTSLPLILAEEMDADWARVRLEWAPAEPETYGYMNPFGKDRQMWIVGSRAVMLYFDQLRIAGAQVRKVLLAGAAEKWGVSAASLRTQPGFVVNPATGRGLSYGEIAAFAKVPAVLPDVDKSELKPKSAFRYIGKSIPRRDIPEKVNGSARFAIDVNLPGMVYASSRHSPVHGGQPDSWNEEQVKAMPGVLGLVRVPDGVAVVADSFPRAMAARRALVVKWKTGAAAQGFDSELALNETYEKMHADPTAKTQRLDSKGDAKAAFSAAAKTYKAEYRSDFGYHAQMEPLNAVARLNDAGDKVEVWEGTQAPDDSCKAVAKALGFRLDQVMLNQCYMGGGFGRRTEGDYAAEAALIAREARRPVKLVWTREEDMAHGMFRPQSFQCLEAALDKDGKVNGWMHCVVGDGGPPPGAFLFTGIRPHYYNIPNQHIEARFVAHGVRTKHWRAVGHVFNVFAIESFVDQMAVDQGMDPLAFRFERMSITPRARAVFEKVAQMSDWKAPRPKGRALGISISDRSRSLGAGVAEISLDRATGKIRVHKTWLAIDGGTIVQPQMAKKNIESGIVYGLSSVLHERVTIKDGAVQQSNFHDYHVLRMSDMPEEMNVAFIDSDAPPTGLGEIGNPWVAAAVANAFFRLTGKRLQHMPFTPERVQALLKA